MKQYCLLTGIDLSMDGATNGIKGMCLNCQSCKMNDNQSSNDENPFVCDNEKVMEVGVKKIMANLPEGFEIESIKLKPMVLKDPTKKCKNYSPDMDRIVKYVENWFVPSNDTEKENASE